MTLYEFVVGGGIILSSSLLAVLVSCFPGARRRCVLSMSGLDWAPASRRRDPVPPPANSPTIVEPLLRAAP